MNDVHISGVIVNTNIKEIDRLLSELFIDYEYNLEEFELYIEADDFDLFFRLDTNDKDILVSSLYGEGLESAQQLLSKISGIFNENNIIYSFNYYEENPSESGNEKLLEISHPDY